MFLSVFLSLCPPLKVKPCVALTVECRCGIVRRVLFVFCRLLNAPVSSSDLYVTSSPA